MSQIYNIEMKLRLKENTEKEVRACLHGDNTEMSLKEIVDKSVGELFKGKRRIDGSFEYSANLEAVYSYYSILENFFSSLAPSLKDGSYMDVYYGNNFCRYIIVNGEIEYHAENETIDPFFDDGSHFYEEVTNCERGFYNTETHVFVAGIDPDIIVYNLSVKEAKMLTRIARVHGNTWLDNLDRKDGRVFREDIAADYLGELLKNHPGDWMYCGEYCDEYNLNKIPQNMYVYKDFCDGDPYGREKLKLYDCKDDALEDLKADVEKWFKCPWDKIMNGPGHDYFTGDFAGTLEPDYVCFETPDGYQFFIVQELPVNTSTLIAKKEESNV